MTHTLEILKENIRKAIIGKDEIVELFLNAYLNKGHILLESVPGTGKTMLARSFAKSAGGTFKRIQFTPDVLPSDVTGIQFFNPKTQEFQLRMGPVMTNILLADEINRATPRTQSSLLEVMEERQATIDGESISLPSPFMVIATQNPVESQQGTFSLPEAQMDRFFFQVDMGYPSFEEERDIMRTYRARNPIEEIAAVLTGEDILRMQKEVQEVGVSEEMESYILSIVHATRNHPDIEIGASPRGTLAFMRAAQGRAYLAGRTFITPDDVKHVAPFVLSHRLSLSIEGSLKKTNVMVIKDILSSMEVPVESGGQR